MRTHHDLATHRPVTGHQLLAAGRISTFVEESFEVPGPEGPVTVHRQFVSHPGAVAVIALDDDDRVACVRQYRHPVGMTMVEPPAGLLDRPDEDPWLAAQRELAEEAELAADQWAVLADVCLTPGGSSETIRIFLATGLRATAHPEGFHPSGEEYAMDLVWVPLADAVDGILEGRLGSPSLVAGVLALQAARSRSHVLRAPGAPWPARELQRRRLDGLFDELRR